VALPGLTQSRVQPTAAQATEGLTWRALLLAVLLTIICGVWVRQAEILVIATQITESVPAIPALAVLFLLLALNPLLRFLRRGAQFSRVEMLTVYTFVGIAISMAGCGVARYWVSTVTALWWWATPANGMASLQRFIPTWLVPHSSPTILGLYMGGGSVPWEEWWVPLLAWTGFFAVFWCAMLCLLVLVRKRWMQEERLSFPIVELALEMTESGTGRATQRPFFLNPIMWIGFSLTFLFNLINIVHALRPAMPGIPWYTSVGPTNASLPWNTVFPLTVAFTPLLIGFGFLVSTEVSFSIWFFFFVYKFEALLAGSLGYNTAGIPYPQEQSMGAFLLLGLGLLWSTRGTFKRALLDLFTRAPSPRDPGSPFPLRWALLGFAASSLLVLGFCCLAGMAAWLALLYLGLLGCVALVCARIRAEAGIPLIWAFPFYIPKQMLMYTFGSAALLSNGGPASLTALALLTFLARGYFPALIGYQVDSFKTAEQTRMKPSHMAVVVMLALLVGVAVAFYFHLVPYYQYGSTHLRNGDIWGTWLAYSDFGQVTQVQRTALAPDPSRIVATGGGFVAAALLVWLRSALGAFPLHPLGFAVATAAGDIVWLSFLIVWVCKTLILRYGGIRLYRAAIPAFLGFALGHVFTAGVVWGLLGAFVPDLVSGYAVWFG